MFNFTEMSLILAAILGGLAYLVGVMAPKQPELWKKLPRERILGEVLVVVCLVWSMVHIIPMLEGNLVRLRVWIRVLMPVVAVMAFFYLDYLFTRALGGLLLLLVTEVLHGAFVVHLPLRPVFSVIAYGLGILAMFLIGTPWRFRDLLEQAHASPRWRMRAAAALGTAALFFAVFAFLG